AGTLPRPACRCRHDPPDRRAGLPAWLFRFSRLQPRIPAPLRRFADGMAAPEREDSQLAVFLFFNLGRYRTAPPHVASMLILQQPPLAVLDGNQLAATIVKAAVVFWRHVVDALRR